MRIMHTDSSMTLGGRELAVLGMAQSLLNRRHSVVLVVQSRSPLERLAKERGIPCETLSLSKFGYLFSIMTFCRHLKRHRIEIVHTHSSTDRWLAVIAASLLTRPPIVILGRHHCGRINLSRANRLLYGRLARCIVVTGGERLRQELIGQTGFEAVRIEAIPTGVDPERFRPGTGGASVRNDLGIAPTEYVVGSVSFLRNYKGLHHFIDAADLLLRKIPQTRFLIVGDGPERSNLIAHINRLALASKILMVGHTEHVPETMAALDVMAVTSTGTETLTQVIPQALAMEKPVVATNVGSIPDIVLHGTTGLLVPPGNPQALAESLLLVL